MNGRNIQIAAVLISAALLAAASRFSTGINATRSQLDMMGVDDVTAKAPPEYAFAIQAFGAFRGILTNIAFIRAEELKTQGRYYDAMQLANWICQLQPRFPAVWEFQSWNMAWNISITSHTPNERWNWIYNGIKLIRDEGLRYNPRAINLYKQIAWIYVNKMSETTDEYHLFFKRQWAWRMHLVLGSPPERIGGYDPREEFEPLTEYGLRADHDFLKAAEREAERRVKRLADRLEQTGDPWTRRSLEVAEHMLEDLRAGIIEDGDMSSAGIRNMLFAAEVAKKAAAERMMEIANAPDSLEGVYATHPDARRMVSDLRAIGVYLSDDRISEDLFWPEKTGVAFTFFYRYRMLVEPPALLGELLRTKAEDPDEELREQFGRILGVAENDPAGQTLVRWLQKKVLRESFRLDASKMAELTARFGPIDWRMVDAHSLYWVNEGLVAAGETIGDFNNDRTNTTRLIFFSLRNLFNKNDMVFEPYTTDVNYAYINFNPDVNFIEPMNQAFIMYGRLIDPDPEVTGAGFTFRSGHVNFLAEAIRLLYFSGRVTEAAHYYEYLRRAYGRLDSGEPNPALAKPLRDYAIDSLRDNAGIQRDIRTFILALLDRAWSLLARGNVAMARQLVELAREEHVKFNEEMGTERIEKVRLPEFEHMVQDSLVTSFSRPALNEFMLREKAVLWQRIPIFTQVRIYDRAIAPLRAECELFDFIEQNAFPEPPGMNEYRDSAESRARLQERDERIFTPTQPR